MKVLFDHQTFTLQEYGGISRYFFELYNRFDQIDHISETSLFLSNNAYLNGQNSKNITSFFPGKKFKGKIRIQEAVNKFQSISKIRAGDFDIFHPTYYNPYFLKHLKGKPFVVTFLDMIHEKFADQYAELKLDNTIYNNKKILLENATKVIAISNSTKQDIMDVFGVSGDNIEVIYLGSSFGGEIMDSVRLIERPYLLYVGRRSLYKNFAFYLESIAEIIKAEDILIVCGGGENLTKEEADLINTLGLMDLVKFVPINDQILENLYTHAISFVFPSLYEGFGIPVLEAFSCGCPCLLSDGGSLPEVGGDAVLYFDPENSDSIAKSLRSMLDDENLRLELIKKGYERVKNFSWQNTFDDTIELYKSL